MRIVAIRQTTAHLKSDMRNAFIDFSQMTVSVVALVTDQRRDGRPVVGYGLGSNGRYGQGGILRERLIPRIMRAAPESMLDDSGRNLDPFRVMHTEMSSVGKGGVCEWRCGGSPYY